MAASEAELARRTMWLGELAAFLSVIATMFRGPNGGVQDQPVLPSDQPHCNRAFFLWLSVDDEKQ